MADDLHCPQCRTRITPYEHEHNDKMTKGKVIHACWNCGLPMETVLAQNEQGIRTLAAPRLSLSQAEQELADLRAEVARLKDIQIRPPVEPPVFPHVEVEERAPAPAPAHETAIPLALPPSPKGLVSESEAASPPPFKWKDGTPMETPATAHRGPGRPRTVK